MRKNRVLPVLVFLLTFLIGANGLSFRALAAPPAQVPTPAALGPAIDQAIKAKFEKEAQPENNIIPAFLIYGQKIISTQYSADGNTAILWVALTDPANNYDIIATEPALAIARKSPSALPADPASWSITFQNAPDWIKQLRSLPSELISDEMRASLIDVDQNVIGPSATQTFTGYKLPWAGGTAKRLSGSIGHFLEYHSCNEANCRYAYDFADGTMFPLLAAKGGMVVAFRDTCQNNDHNCTNYLTLRDDSTVPTTFQLYYHLANGSIPKKLQNIGNPVVQGELIGNVDNTGYSTGHHLHFHVFVSPTSANYFWGMSVKMAFDEVTINDGQPRKCSEAANWPGYGTECNAGKDGKRGTSDDDWFVSANTPANLPVATLDEPAENSAILTNHLTVWGTATDDAQIVRIQTQVNYDGTWKTLDSFQPEGNGVFNRAIDLCTPANSVPKGPFALIVNVFDYEGGQAPNMPVRHLNKIFACDPIPVPPAPACDPLPNQVALYSDTDFRGTCQKFDVNYQTGYTALGALDNKVVSVQVGTGARAILFDQSAEVLMNNPTARVETLEASDANLADNSIGVDSVSGMLVVGKNTLATPVLILPVQNKFNADSLVLSWLPGVNDTLYEVSLSGPRSLQASVTDSSISVGSLPAGNYNLTVLAKNSLDTAGRAASRSFSISAVAQAATKSSPFPMPFQDALDYADNAAAAAQGWVTSGLWHIAPVNNVGFRSDAHAWQYNNGSTYNDPAQLSGDLTSPAIVIPDGYGAYLRFDYFFETQDVNSHWDQRWVQVAVLDPQSQTFGVFENLAQLGDDQQPVGPIWLNSGPLSLAPYAGKTIRLRFHFDAVDTYHNAGLGWLIDNVAVNDQAPDFSCADFNDTPATATAMAPGLTISGVICPQRDVDYLKVSLRGGVAYRMDVDATTLTPPSTLDAQLFLLDADGRSVIAQSDDEEAGVKQDPLLIYTPQRSGIYYIKIKAWDYPGSGDAAHTYQLMLSQSTYPYTFSLPMMTVNGMP